MATDKQISIRAKIQSVEERLKQLRTQERELSNRLKTIDSQKKRKDETRKKIIVGAITLAEMEKDLSLRSVFLEKLDSILQKPSDRNLFNLSIKHLSKS